MLAIVTGAQGFIGRRLVSGLTAAGWTCLGVDSKNDVGPTLLVDRVLYTIKNSRGPCCVLHFGAISSTSAEDDGVLEGANVLSTRLWGELCSEFDIPLVFASSLGVYGNPKDWSKRVASEEAALTPYARSKVRAEKALSNRKTACILRLSNVYGPGEETKPGQAFVHFAAEKIRKGEPVTIYDPDPYRDWLYVDDVVQVCREVVEKRLAGVFELGGGQSYAFGRVAQLAADAVGRLYAQIDERTMPAEMRRRYQLNTLADLAPLRNAGVEWTPTSLYDGLRKWLGSTAPATPDTPRA